MVDSILKYYLEDSELQIGFMPLALDVFDPDFYLYLFARKDNQAWYVVAEDSYFSQLNEVVEDIEETFAVSVDGWLALLDKRTSAEQHFLPADFFKTMDSKKVSDGLKKVMYEKNKEFVVLKVTPKGMRTNLVASMTTSRLQVFYQVAVLPQFGLKTAGITWSKSARLGPDELADWFELNGEAYVLIYEDNFGLGKNPDFVNKHLNLKVGEYDFVPPTSKNPMDAMPSYVGFKLPVPYRYVEGVTGSFTLLRLL